MWDGAYAGINPGGVSGIANLLHHPLDYNLKSFNMSVSGFGIRMSAILCIAA